MTLKSKIIMSIQLTLTVLLLVPKNGSLMVHNINFGSIFMLCESDNSNRKKVITIHVTCTLKNTKSYMLKNGCFVNLQVYDTYDNTYNIFTKSVY